MYTGIVQAVGSVASKTHRNQWLHYTVTFPKHLLKGLQLGASVSVDGVCQTVVALEGAHVSFDASPETLKCTTLGSLGVGDCVNLERSAKWGDEIGGHLLAGHVCDKIQLLSQTDMVYTFSCPPNLRKYFFHKGFVALNGVSLTICDLQSECFSIHFIPETFKRTTFASKKPGDWVNLEIDASTRAIVDTVLRNFRVQKVFC